MIDCLIVGAGPAGLTAGIYLRRFHRSVCIVDNSQSRAARIPLSHNYPGFPDGVNGKQLLELLRQQLAQFGGSITQGTVTELKKISEDEFTAEFSGQTISARNVLLATGIVDIEPDLAGYETVRTSDLVRFCPICDGFEFTDQRIGIIGRGKHGVRECEFIKNFSHRLSYISLDATDAIRAATQKLRDANITVIGGHGGRIFGNSNESKNIGIETVDGVLHEFDIIYCALGCKVRSALALSLGALHDDQDCLVVNDQLETSIKGFFAAGDVVSSLDQLAVATGQAAIASTAIHNRLRGL